MYIKSNKTRSSTTLQNRRSWSVLVTEKQSSLQEAQERRVTIFPLPNTAQVAPGWLWWAWDFYECFRLIKCGKQSSYFRDFIAGFTVQSISSKNLVSKDMNLDDSHSFRVFFVSFTLLKLGCYPELLELEVQN